MTMTVMRITTVSLMALALVALRRGVTVTRSEAPAFVAVGLMDVGANLAFGLASTLGMLSLVSVFGSLYPVATILLARFIDHERLRRSSRSGSSWPSAAWRPSPPDSRSRGWIIGPWHTTMERTGSPSTRPSRSTGSAGGSRRTSSGWTSSTTFAWPLMTWSWTSDRDRHCSWTPCSLAVIGGWWPSTCPRQPSSGSGTGGQPAWGPVHRGGCPHPSGRGACRALARPRRLPLPDRPCGPACLRRVPARRAGPHRPRDRGDLRPRRARDVQRTAGPALRRRRAGRCTRVRPADIVRSEPRLHSTPWGTTQPFTVVVLANGSGAEGAQDVAH